MIHEADVLRQRFELVKLNRNFAHTDDRKRKLEDRSLAAFSFIMGAVFGAVWAGFIVWACLQ